MENDTDKIELCLKCGSRITHVPYQFEGKVFHARCLLCNACGRRLVGKPFITKNRQIFCGDLCKSQFEQGIRPPHLKDPPETNSKSPGDSFSDAGHSVLLDDSLTEALEVLQEEPNPVERVTDYPVGVFLGSNQAHSFETDSISTFSESSFTSDSSVAYDASKKPKKKILKTLRASQGKNKLRVRWNLNDHDDVSLSSLNSIRSDSGLLNSHTEAARQTLQKWRDFERPLPPGSTGLTPTKNKFLSKSTNSLIPPGQANQHRMHPLSPPNGVRPGLHPLHLEHQSPPSKRSSPSPGYKPHQLVARHDSAPTRTSNLISRLAVSPQKEDRAPYRLHHAQLSPQGQWQEESSTSSVLDVSVFQFDEKNLPQLERSSLEDRKGSHLFEFPRKTSPLARARPESKKPAIASDDGNDYDHLQENEEAKSMAESEHRHGHQAIPPPRIVKAKDRLAPQIPDKWWYTKEDIEDALRTLEEDDPEKEQVGGQRRNSGSSKHTLSKAQVPVSDEGEDYDHLNSPPPVPPKQRRSSYTWHKPSLPSESSVPPPLPPKKRHSSSGSDTPLSPLSPIGPETSKVNFHADVPAATSTPNHTPADRTYQMEESIILSPPSEFAGSFTTETGKSSRRQNFSPSPQLDDLPHSHSCDTLTGSDSPSQHVAREEPPASKEPDIYPEAAMAPRPASSWSSPPSEEEPVFRSNNRVVEGAEDTVPSLSPTRNFPAATDQPLSLQQKPHNADHPHGSGSTSSGSPRSAWPASAVDKELGRKEKTSPHPDRHQLQPSVDCYHLPVVDSNSTKTTSSAEIAHEAKPLSKWFQNNSKLANKKPPAAEMDTDLQKLLDDLDIDTIVEETSSQHHSGVCCVCHTIIPSTRFLLSHAGKVYHIGCFSCVQCGCPLKGQKIFTLQNGSVLCEEHYRRLLLVQQEQQHHQRTAAFRRNNQPLHYPAPQNNFPFQQPQSNYPYKRVPTKPSSSYTMV